MSIILLAALLLLPTLPANASDRPAAGAGEHAGAGAPGIQSLAAVALAHVAAARAALHRHHPDAAMQSISRIPVLLDLMRTARPDGGIYALVDYLRDLLTFEDNVEVLADSMPVKRVLEAMSSTGQVAIARNHFRQLEQALADPNGGAPLKALDDMRKALRIESFDFPLSAAEEKIHQIFKRYEENQNSLQDETLLSIEQDLLQLLAHGTGESG